MAGSSIVGGIVNSSPSAIRRMVPRRIFPARVLGSRSTTTAALNAATGPTRGRPRVRGPRGAGGAPERARVRTGRRTRRRAGDGGKPLDAAAVRGDRPAGLGLPPVVDHRHAQLRLGPVERLRVAPLAGEEERA